MHEAVELEKELLHKDINTRLNLAAKIEQEARDIINTVDAAIRKEKGEIKIIKKETKLTSAGGITQEEFLKTNKPLEQVKFSQEDYLRKQ